MHLQSCSELFPASWLLLHHREIRNGTKTTGAKLHIHAMQREVFNLVREASAHFPQGSCRTFWMRITRKLLVWFKGWPEDGKGKALLPWISRP